MPAETKRGRGRPALAEYVERLNISLPAELLRLVEQRAQQEGVTRVEWMRRAMLLALAR